MITAKLVHDVRWEKKSGKYPVKVRVTHERRSKYFETGISLSKEEYEKLSAKRISAELNKIKIELDEAENKANQLVKEVKPFNFPVFEQRFKQKTYDSSFIETLFDEMIAKLRLQDRIGTADNYQRSINSLKAFKEGIRFEDVNDVFLYSFEKWMLDKGRSITTVGIYLRVLRAIFNEAIYRKLISAEYYPFSKRRYLMPTGKNVKKALSLAEIGKIFNYEPKTDQEAKAKAFWLFSYFANGMNMTDIANLKFKNISGEFINFERAKTIRSMRSNPKVISAYITDELKAIIKKWGNWDTNKDNYIFPILSPGLASSQQRERIKDFIWRVNKALKSIAGDLGIDKSLTTYTARHSFSTVLKRSGASIEFISESLGHSSVKTTAFYLDSFEDDKKREYARSLMGFQKII